MAIFKSFFYVYRTVNGMFTAVFNWCRISQPSTVWYLLANMQKALEHGQIFFLWICSETNCGSFHIVPWLFTRGNLT